MIVVNGKPLDWRDWYDGWAGVWWDVNVTAWDYALSDADLEFEFDHSANAEWQEYDEMLVQC